MTTRKELIENLIDKFKKEVNPFVDDIDKIINFNNLGIIDLIFFLNSLLTLHNGNIDSIINSLFQLNNIETKDDEKVKEKMKEFIEDFLEIPA
jgi:hypothetical protein